MARGESRTNTFFRLVATSFSARIPLDGTRATGLDSGEIIAPQLKAVSVVAFPGMGVTVVAESVLHEMERELGREIDEWLTNIAR